VLAVQGLGLRFIRSQLPPESFIDLAIEFRKLG
jgi:hypothetical protein